MPYKHHPKSNQAVLTGASRTSKIITVDCEDGATNSSLVLIDQKENTSGLLILSIRALIAEVFAGATEDQGIITVSDESDNALSTLTPTDAGADALNDIVLGYQIEDATTGAAGKVVAAGEFVDCAVTQATSGAGAAGKMKVIVEYINL